MSTKTHWRERKRLLQRDRKMLSAVWRVRKFVFDRGEWYPPVKKERKQALHVKEWWRELSRLKSH